MSTSYISKQDLKKILLKKSKDKYLKNKLRYHLNRGEFPSDLLDLYPTLEKRIRKYFKIKEIKQNSNNIPYLLLILEGEITKAPERDVNIVLKQIDKLPWYLEYHEWYHLHILWLYLFKRELFYPIKKYIPSRYYKLLNPNHRIHPKKLYPIDIQFTPKIVSELAEPLFMDEGNFETLYEFAWNNIKDPSFRKLMDKTKKEFKRKSNIKGPYNKSINWSLLFGITK